MGMVSQDSTNYYSCALFFAYQLSIILDSGVELGGDCFGGPKGKKNPLRP
jgi:hypothetical protein